MLAFYKKQNIYANGLPVILNTGTNGCMLKVQAKFKYGANLDYQIVGSLDKDSDMVVLMGINDSTAQYTVDMTGTAVYTFDVTGYEEVTVKPVSQTGDTRNIEVIATIYREI